MSFERDDWIFLSRNFDGVDKPVVDAERILDALDRPGHVVGASYGGVGAMLAAAGSPSKVLSLVLFEPAVFSVARGRPNIEAHVAALGRVFEDAD